MVVRLILLAVLVFGIADSAFAGPSTPRRPKPVPLDPSNSFILPDTDGSDVTCGLIGGSWVPGRFIGSNFMTVANDIKKFRTTLRTASETQAKKLKKKLKNLKLQQRTDTARCDPGPPPTPTPTPTATPTPTPLPNALIELSRAVTRDDINHLYRRAGLGVPPAAALEFVGQPVGPLVDYFMTYVEEPAIETEAQTYLDENVASPHYPTNPPTLVGLQLYALRTLLLTQNQFHERLAWLGLHDRLATSADILTEVSQRYLMVEHFNLLRRHSRDMDYATLLEEIGEEPVMLQWLTLNQNTRTAPNENYARELMELFSLDPTDSAGNANYSDTDIAEVARAFTGWNLIRFGTQWRTTFTPATFDPGQKTIFSGTSAQGNVTTSRETVRHILRNHPNSGPSAAKWLCRDYLTDTPSADVVGLLGGMLKADNFNIKNAIAKILKSEDFYRPENRLSIAKQPVERFVHVFRAASSVGMPFDMSSLRSNLSGMGCVITAPETVFGCDRLEEVPDGQRLINSLNAFTTLSNNNTLFTQRAWDYSRFLPSAAPTAADVIVNFETIFGTSITAEQRTALTTYLNTRMNSNGTIATENWDPANTSHVRRKVSGLFRIFTALPQLHDVK